MKMKSKLSTKFIITFTAALTFIFLIMLGAVQISMNVYMRGYIRDSIYSFHEDLDKSVVAVIDEVAYTYARMTRPENALTLDGLGSGNSYAVRSQSLQELVEQSRAEGFFADIGWRDKSGYLSVNGYASPSEDVFIEAEKQRNKVFTGGYKNGCHSFAVYMSNDVTSAEGCFVFFMPETAVGNALSLFGTEVGYSYIIRTDGYVFSHEDKDYVGKYFYYDNMYSLDGQASMQTMKMDGSRKIILVSPMANINSRYGFGFSLVSVLDYAYYYGTFEALTYILIAVAVAMFSAGVLVAVIRAKKLSKPIARLHSEIDETIRTGEKGRLKKNAGDELYGLEEKYDEMITHIFELMQKSREDAETQRKLELDALQMQINPHFLYNTLDAVTWMAKIKKEPEIENLAVNLAKFFRLSLHKSDKFITVGEELELTEHYLEIDKIRFPDKVSVKFETDESLVKYKVLKLILQPVVENALKYAFVEGKGNMTIKTYLSDGDIIFEVTDDGAGFDVPDDILSGKKNKSGLGGYGLYNVNGRVKLEYGEKYGLEIISHKGSGTKVTVRVAKRI